MNPVQPHTTQHRAQGVLFWALLALGFTGLAPSVLLPEWRQYESLRQAEVVETQRLEQLEQRVAGVRAALDALRDDPAVLARLAQRDLSYQRVDQEVVPVSVGLWPADELGAFDSTGGRSDMHDSLRPGVPGGGIGRSKPSAIQPSPIVASILARLPDYDYDGVFCDDRTRPIVMAMSVALIAAAFVLFMPYRRHTRHFRVE